MLRSGGPTPPPSCRRSPRRCAARRCSRPRNSPSLGARSVGAAVHRGGEKGTLLNSDSLTPKPLASSVYVRVPEARSPHKRSILVTSVFPSRYPRRTPALTPRSSHGPAKLWPREALLGNLLPLAYRRFAGRCAEIAEASCIHARSFSRKHQPQASDPPGCIPYDHRRPVLSESQAPWRRTSRGRVARHCPVSRSQTLTVRSDEAERAR